MIVGEFELVFDLGSVTILQPGVGEIVATDEQLKQLYDLVLRVRSPACDPQATEGLMEWLPPPVITHRDPYLS